MPSDSKGNMLLIGTGLISFFFVNVYQMLYLSKYDNKISITNVERDRNANLNDVDFHGYGLKEGIEMVGFLARVILSITLYYSQNKLKIKNDNVNFLFYSQRKSTSLCSTKYYVPIVDILYYGNSFQHGRKFLS